MSLISPGVQINIIDESQYLSAPSSSVPLLVIATAQNKVNAAGTGVAIGTTKANANKLYQVTSQRDLVTIFGNPFFYKTQNGTPIQGYELNEYGLLAAYSVLGVSNRCYVLRADIDLASLVGSVTRPSGSPVNNTHWLDTTKTAWGIYEFNSITSKFVNKKPIVITDESSLLDGTLSPSIGTVGDYAVIAIPPARNILTDQGVLYKTEENVWVKVGSHEWTNSIPTVTGANSSASLTIGQSFSIKVQDTTRLITVDATNTSAGIADVINNDETLADLGITAGVQSGRLVIFSAQPGRGKFIELAEVGSGTVLNSLGIKAGVIYQPAISYGKNSEMPLWSSSQTKPHPSKSLWFKIGSPGSGSVYEFMRYNESVSSYQRQSVTQHLSDLLATASLDSAGGKNIPAKTIYAQYAAGGANLGAPVYFWQRTAEGETIVTGTNTSVTTLVPSDQIKVRVSVPASKTLSNEYTLTLTGSTANSFVSVWNSAGIPGTKCVISATGAIELSHIHGGQIVMSDFNSAGVSNGSLAKLGFVPGTTNNVKTGPFLSQTFMDVSGESSEIGEGAEFNVTTLENGYSVSLASIGSDYAVGELIILSGEDLGGTSENDLKLKVTSVSSGEITGVEIISGESVAKYTTELSNWVPFAYTANQGAPRVNPANNTNWYYSSVRDVDIMVNKNGSWIGYKNTGYESTGKPSGTGVNTTDPQGVIINTEAPTTQSDGSTPLSYGDLWLDSNDLENYPALSRWESVDGVSQWVKIDVTDQVSEDGIVFADARWSNSDATDIINDPIPKIVDLLTSDYLDLDAPDAGLYPQGTLLFNTRRSGYNVKQFRINHFNNKSFEGSLPAYTNSWVSISGNKDDGSAYLGRKAQRNLIVQALKKAILTNEEIREEDSATNLLAAPGYPELQSEMIQLNNERDNTMYIVGDTPLRLPPDATTIANWANNTAGASSTGDEGLVTRNEYLGLYYPSGISTDLTGANVVVPASHMILRTMLRNDQIAYPWFAAAGTRRGTIDNASNIGYIDSASGEFKPIKTRQGLRDVLYENEINPMAFFTGVGIVNYGNKNSRDTQSALDRTNVSRLVAYIRERLAIAVRPFIFEPNDRLTRQQVAGVIESLFIDINSKRGLNDWLVVVDESNNTPERIDRNELWIDIAIEPIKALEFVYIPVRILNTGEIGKL